MQNIHQSNNTCQMDPSCTHGHAGVTSDPQGADPPDRPLGDLKLDSFKKNSNYNTKKPLGKCPSARFYTDLIIHEETGERLVRAVLGCKKWSCPVCGPLNARRLREKTKNGIKTIMDRIRTHGYRDKYFFKFLTLTLPGESFRRAYSLDMAERELKQNFNKLRTAIKKKYGDFEYIWVCEPQRDGFPHLHVLMIGKNIAGIDVKDFIERMWRDNYSMGFVKLNVVDGGLEKVIGYITKYMTKGLQAGNKHNHVYSMSMKLKQVAKMEMPVVTVVEYGRFDYDDDNKIMYSPIYSRASGFDPDKENDFLMQRAEEIGNWFLSQRSYPRQSSLWDSEAE